MKTTTTIALIALSTLTLSALIAAADDWPRFRGPGGTGISRAKGVPTEWDAKKNLQWKEELPGPGASSPIIIGNKIFVTCYSGYGTGADGEDIENLKRHLLCFDRHKGTKLWEKTVAAVQPEDPYRGYIQEHGYASATPVSDGKHVFVFYGKSGALAYDLDGNEKWRKELGKEPSSRGWGSGASPIVYQDKVIINAGEESSAIYALSKTDGKQVWKAEGDLKMAYGTPVVMKVTGDREDLVISIPGEVWGLNPGNGKLRWYAETGLTGNISPSVVVDDSDTVFAFGGFPRTGRYAVKIDTKKKGDLGTESKLWSGNETTYVPTPVLHEGHLYWVNDRGLAHCVEAKSGKLVYKERLPDVFSGSSRGSRPFYASAVLIDEKLYVVSRNSGTYIIDAKPEFKVLVHNKIEGDKSIYNASPAVTDGQMILRSNKFLYAIAPALNK